MAFSVTNFLDLLRKFDRLLEAEKKVSILIESLDRKVDGLSERLTRLEARESLLIAEAKAAAATAASAAATQNLTDVARRVGGLEERVNRLDNPMLPSTAAHGANRRIAANPEREGEDQ